MGKSHKLISSCMWKDLLPSAGPKSWPHSSAVRFLWSGFRRSMLPVRRWRRRRQSSIIGWEQFSFLAPIFHRPSLWCRTTIATRTFISRRWFAPVCSAHQGNDFKIYYRLRKKKVITVTLNTYHDVHYFPVDSRRWYSRSYSTRIAEVANADTPNEREKPVGHDGGFLWRINSYWKFEEKDGGVYIECESISLTRDIPTGLGWLIKPFVTSIPKESLEMTMGSTRAALAAGKDGN